MVYTPAVSKTDLSGGTTALIPDNRAHWSRFLLAVVLTALTLSLRVYFANSFDGPTVIVFTVPIVLSAYWGGLGPGLLATGIATVGAAYFVLPPLHDFRVASETQRLQEVILLATGALISVICQRMHQSRKRVELVVADLEATQTELKNALKSAGDLRVALEEHAIVAVTDQRGIIQHVNDKFCRISQYTREELIGQDHRIINSGYHSAEFIRDLWRTIANGKAWHGDIRNRAKDGSYYWVDTTLVPFLDDRGKPKQYIAIRADITERQRAQDALRISEQQFRTMANSIPQLAWIAHPDGTVHWYNDRWYDYTGTTPEEMFSSDRQSRLTPEMVPIVMERWKIAISTKMPFEMEFPIRGVDGHYRTFLTRVHPVKDAEGNVTQWIGTSTDVDELKRAEEEVLRLNASLEQRVLERTAEVEAANKELESFSYSVSHDLRAPLRAMNGFAQLAIEEFGESMPPEAAHYLSRIRNGGKQMGQLIDDLLAFSRLGRRNVQRRSVSMSAIVEEVLTDFDPLKLGRDIRFHVLELSPSSGDASLLKQVWINLISNAVKYSRGRDVAIIEIGSGPSAAETEYWIRDNGTGFDMEYANKLFEVFQRLHRADEFEGTGVGLAIVQRVIHRHGGRVWAEASPGQGATFRFTLPNEDAA